MNKLTIPIILILILVASVYFIFFNSAPELQLDKCGDGICDNSEKTNPNLCPGNCEIPIVLAENSPFGILDPAVPKIDKIEDVTAVGAKWVRYAAPYWIPHDQLYSETYNKNIKMIINVTPAFSINNQQKMAEKPERMPKDIEGYKDFLMKAVERYDGDGINDAPGSPVIDIWQINNEIDLGWGDSPEDYAKLLKISYQTIKKANPKARVAIGGAADPIGFYDEDSVYGRILKELDRIKDNPKDRYFDIFDFHWYPFTRDYLLVESATTPGHIGEIFYFKQSLDRIKKTLAQYGYGNVPIYITEFAQYSGLPDQPWGPPQSGRKLALHSEKKQADDLIKEYVFGLANGVKKIFWVTLTEWHKFGGVSDGVFDNVGLIHNSQNHGLSHKKLSYYTYKKMVEVLEGSDWNNIQTIQESDGIYIYKFTKNGKPIWVAWNDDSKAKAIALDVGNLNSVKITEAIPKYKSGRDVVNYLTAFNAEIKPVSNGKITVMLGDKPVFVEEK